jgi:hypothetical protein
MTNNASNSLKIARQQIPTLINVTVVGMLAGLSFCVQFGFLPLLNRMDAASYLTVMHGIFPAFATAVKPLIAMGTVTFLVRLIWLRSSCVRAQYWILLSFLFFLAGTLITFLGHFPINRQFMAWKIENPPAEWEILRTHWSQLNFWRFAVAQLCFVTVLIPIVFGKQHAASLRN